MAFPVLVGTGNAKPIASAGGQAGGGGAATYASVVLGYSPLAYWRMNETSGTLITDSGGGGYGGTYTGVTLNSVTGPNGQPAGFWDGVNDYANVSAGAAAVSGANQFLVSMWTFITQAEWEDATAVTVSAFEAGSDVARVIQNAAAASESNYRATVNIGGGEANILPGSVVWPNTWQHILLFLNAASGTAIMWVDGAAVGTASPTGDPTDLTFTTGIVGAAANTFSRAEGYFADVAIWVDTTPDAAMITALSTAIP